MRHFINLSDYTGEELLNILDLADDLKARLKRGIREPLFPRRTLAMIFEKQSLRTRVSFDCAMTHLGGSAMYLSGAEIGFGQRETWKEFASVLSEMVDLVMVRAKHHQDVVSLAKYSSIPVINGLTDFSHPCQAMADIMTFRELLKEKTGANSLVGKTLAWVGDGNNVAFSLAEICGLMGIRFTMGTPDGYRFTPEMTDYLTHHVPNLNMTVYENPADAVKGASVVYTDVWVSMGQEDLKAQKEKDLRPYQVNEELMANCPDAWFMHCLPARHNLEVTEGDLESPQCKIFQQAGNRLHAQKAILAALMREQDADGWAN